MIKEEKRRVKESKIELIKNRLILDQIYITFLYFILDQIYTAFLYFTLLDPNVP